jgi:hypothetical protein
MQSSRRRLDSKPIFWVLDSTGNRLRQSHMLLMMVVVLVVQVVMIMFLTYDSFI